MWGSRYDSTPADALARLSLSVQHDWRLAPYHLLATRAHARVLHRAGLLDDSELSKVLAALDDLDSAASRGDFRPQLDDENVHVALERGLFERIGTLAGKLRAGRARNDEVVTDLRLYLRDYARRVVERLAGLEEALIGRAEEHLATPAPGLAHLQPAQPVLLAHHLLAHAQSLARDVARLRDWDVRADVSPFGAGALAGSTLTTDPRLPAEELGFTEIAANSLDAVSDRDFVAEFLFDAALIGVHVSRLGEEIVLWSSPSFGWITLDRAFSSPSGTRPTARNPDIAELARGKAARLLGHLAAFLATLKGLPLGWSRDLQEDKEAVFDAVDTLLTLLPAMTGLVATLAIDTDRLRRLAVADFALASGLVEHLVRRGVSHHEAQDAARHLVVWCLANDVDLPDVPDADLAAVHPLLTPDVREVLTVEGSLAARAVPSGTAPPQVRAQLEALRRIVAEQIQWANH
jgi:argininosuccinate lyase